MREWVCESIEARVDSVEVSQVELKSGKVSQVESNPARRVKPGEASRTRRVEPGKSIQLVRRVESIQLVRRVESIQLVRRVESIRVDSIGQVSRVD